MEKYNEEPFYIELRNMENRLDEMQEKLDQLDIKMTQVVEALLGNSLTKTGGIINEMETINQRLAYLERKQREFDDFRKRFYWTIGFIVSAGLIVQYFINLYIKVK